MGASNAYDVESYRNGAFTQKIWNRRLMDYARYNYIAQPGDKMFVLFAKWDRNDHYSVNWGIV
jgi:hypothetical protein